MRPCGVPAAVHVLACCRLSQLGVVILIFCRVGGWLCLVIVMTICCFIGSYAQLRSTSRNGGDWRVGNQYIEDEHPAKFLDLGTPSFATIA